MGSNVFDTFLGPGAAAVVGSVRAPLRLFATDLAALLLVTGLAAAFLRSARTVPRLEGGLAVASNVLFTVVTVASG